MKQPRGVTLLEVVFAMGLFSLLLLVLVLLLRDGLAAWRAVDSEFDAHAQVKRAQTFIERDLRRASLDELNVEPVSGPPATFQGDAVWFLSAWNDWDFNPGRNIASNVNGEPIWQANVIYYLSQPGNHDSIYGMSCGGANGGGGYDAGCPHKFLIRLVVDAVNQSGDPYDTSNPETLLSVAQMQSYAKATANGFDASNLSAPAQVRDVKIVASALLWFRVETPVPAVAPLTVDMPGVDVTLKALRLQEAQKETRIGDVDLGNSRFVLESVTRIFPNN